MSLRTLFIAGMLLFLPQAIHAQWTQLSTGGATNDIYCVRYAASGDVWAGTWNGVFRSSNSGATFNFVNGLNATLGNSQIIGSFDDIHVTGTGTAVATGFYYLGNDLIIFGTTNNGASWSHNYYSNSGSLLRYLEAFDFDSNGNGVAVGDVGRVFRSTNNGSSWTPSSSGTTNTLYDVSWVNGSEWVIVSGTNIYRSVNNGSSWSSVLGGQNSMENVSFAHGTSTGYAGGSNELKKSTDGGLTWSSLNIPPMSIRCVYTVSPDTVYLGTYDALYRSISGGLYWERFDLPGFQRINDINFYDANNGMVAGDSGYVAVTANGGGVPIPVAYFNLLNNAPCQGDAISLANFGDPAWSYQWLLNGNVVSTQFSPSFPLTTSGTNAIDLIATHNSVSDTFSLGVNVTPLPLVTPFVVINDTICQNGQGHFRIPNSQIFVNYALFDGTTFVTSLGGTGDTISLTTNSNQSIVKPYRIRGIYTNSCGADTLEVIDSLWIATPAANVSAMLYRDTICTGDTTYMLISNSETGWEYFCSNASWITVDGNGGAIGIPIGPITSSQTMTVGARFKSLNCYKNLPGTFTLTYRSTSVSVNPGTLQGAVGQPITMNASSTGFNAWDWDFGSAASPPTGSGQTPTAPAYSISGIDTITLTARLDYTCLKIIRKPVYVYGSLPVSNTISCDIDTAIGTIGTTTYKYCIDDYNNLHAVGYNSQSTNFAFTPYIQRIDSGGIRNFYVSYNATGNSPGAQGLINGVTSDRLTNTYFATHYTALNRWDIQGNFIRNRNAIVKLNESGKFQWAIEAPLADFSDMITINNRIFAIGINAWNGCEFQTPKGNFTYTPSINNKGEAFIMELNEAGQILSFDAFGGSGNGGYTSPAKFKVKYPIVNPYFAYDTLRQNLMARKSQSGNLLIGGLLDANSIGSPVYFNNLMVGNNLPAGLASEKCLFVAKYDLSNGFTQATTLLCGQPEFITDFKESNNGHFVFTGRAKNKLITSNGTLTFPIQNYEYQFAASFSAGGTLDWIVYADSMAFKAVDINNDGTVTVLAAMTTKFLIVDAIGNPYNLSPVPSLGSYLLRFGSNGELLSADQTAGFLAFTMKEDACGNHVVYHSTGNPQSFRMLRTIHSNNGSCGSNCYEAYDPNLKDMALDSVNLSDVTTGGPAVRNITVKLKSRSVVPVTSLEVKYHINNDPVQSLTWSGTINTGDSVTFSVNAYNFNKSYNRIRVWIQSVNGSVDDYQENDTIITSQIICQNPLAGNYSIGCDTCYFDNIQASATTLKICGVSDPVFMNIEPGTYFEQIKIDSIPFASKSDSIVWTSRNGNTDDVIIDFGCDYSYYRNPFYLFHTHYCTIDHLTIRNSVPRTYDIMQADPSGQSVINLEWVDNLNILNCKLFGIPHSNAVGGNGTAIDCYQGSDINISNNYIYGGEKAIRLGGSFVTARNLTVKDNHCSQNNGIQLIDASNILVDHNKLESIGSVYASSIYVTDCDSILITNNQVTSENWGDKTLDVYCQCSTPNTCRIANNIFSSAPFWLPSAGADINADNMDVVHNSFGHGVFLYTNNNLSFVNNLVRSNGDHVLEISSPNFFSTFNNNRYQSVGSPINFISNGIDYSLAGWKSITGYDAQSDSVTAEYTTLTDMHLRNSIAMPGTTWPGITTDIDGDPRSGTPTIGADEYSFNPLIGEVWPGDCDSTKTVDNFDLLPIGLYYNRFSTSRPNDPSTAWVAQASLLWNDLQSNGINLNHADANGDGWIDQEDTTVVINNYGQSHPLANPNPQRPTAGPDLAVVPVGSIFAAGDTVHLKVMAGNNVLPVDLLSAIGFKVAVPPGLIVPGSYKITIANNWLCPDSNCIMYRRADETNGISAASLARLDGDQVSAYGELADISFVVNAAYTGNPTVTISLNDYRAFDPEVAPISLSPVDGIIQVTNTSAEEIVAFDGLKLYPNPTGGEVKLLINWRGQQDEVVQIEVMDIAGRLVKSYNAVQFRNGAMQIQLDCGDLMNGMYFISLKSRKEIATLKLMKN